MANARVPQTGVPQKSLFWLASYPKSGNTWMRMFLCNYLFDRQTPMPINEVHRLGVTDAAAANFRMAAPNKFDPRDPTLSLMLRGPMLRWLASNQMDVNFVKTHAGRSDLSGVNMIPAELSRGAIYVLRNPLDMVISYARHFGRTYEQAATAISRPGTAISANEKSVRQHIGNWSDHVTSWTGGTEFPILVVRFEDMQADPHAVFTGALALIGVTAEPKRLDRAVRFSSFEELRGQEAAGEFLEHGKRPERFFHTGTAGHWQGILSDALVDKIRSDHGEVMRRFKYLDA